MPHRRKQEPMQRFLSNVSQPSAVRRYAFAVAVSLGALALRLALGPVLGDSAPLLIFVLPVMLSGWYGGRGPGLLTTMICAFLGAYFFLPPFSSIWTDSFADGVRLTIFLIEGVVISTLNGVLHDVRHTAVSDAEALKQSQQELLRSQQELLANQAHFTGIIDTAMDAIITVDDDQRVLLFNTAAEQIFGYHSGEIIGQPLDRLLPPQHRANHAGHIRHFGETGVTRRSMRSPGILNALRRSGEQFPIEATIAQFTSDGRHFFTVILRDISERVRAEQERHEFEHKLQETQRLESLGVLAGGIAHDFNNLLAGVLGNADLALEELPPGAPAHEELIQIHTIAQRAAELTRQMLAYSGRGHFVISYVDLSTLVSEMLRLLETSLPRTATLRHIRGQDEQIVEVDATQIRQVVMNLVINAGEALDEGPGEIVVTTERRARRDASYAAAFVAPDLAPGPYVVLSVTDTGHGISEENLSRIFEPFFTTKFTGRGLGLAAVLGIVRGHRGALYVQTAPGAGTTFDVYLPAAEATEDVEEITLLASAAQRHGRTVLVIDDEEGVRTLVARTLERDGVATLVAADGQMGVDLFRSRAPEIDGVILDMTMPRMSGRETCQAIWQIRPEVPVVLISGYSAQEIAGAFPEAALAAVLQKPFRTTDLRTAVRRMLDGET
ncbi:MAG: hypothetical protein RLZZ387_4733 [Chloroflexota bacterium]